MSIRGTVTFECDRKGCHGEHVVDVKAGEEDIYPGRLEFTAMAFGWRTDDDGSLVCPQCADENPREKYDDDGVKYADPRDAREERR